MMRSSLSCAPYPASGFRYPVSGFAFSLRCPQDITRHRICLTVDLELNTIGNAMLLNEFIKEHRKVEKLEATIVQQQKDFIARLEEQASQIRKVSAKLAAASPSFGGLDASRRAQQTVVSNP